MHYSSSACRGRDTVTHSHSSPSLRIPPPWLLNIPLPSSPCFPIHFTPCPLSLFPDLALYQLELAQPPARSQIGVNSIKSCTHTWPLKLSLIYIDFFLQRLLVALLSDDLNTAIYFRLLTARKRGLKRPKKGFVAYVGLGAGR